MHEPNRQYKTLNKQKIPKRKQYLFQSKEESLDRGLIRTSASTDPGHAVDAPMLRALSNAEKRRVSTRDCQLVEVGLSAGPIAGPVFGLEWPTKLRITLRRIDRFDGAGHERKYRWPGKSVTDRDRV